MDDRFFGVIEDDRDNRKCLRRAYMNMIRNYGNSKNSKLKALTLIGILSDVEDDDITRILKIPYHFLEEVKMDVIHDKLKCPLFADTDVESGTETVSEHCQPQPRKWKRFWYIRYLIQHYYSYFFQYRRMPSVHR